MSRFSDLWYAIQARFLFWYFYLLRLTLRIHVEGQVHSDEAMASGQPILYALWHQQLVPFLAYGYKMFDPARFVVIVVGDDRGNTLSRLVSNFGGGTSAKVDMGGNPVAAGRGVLNIIRLMKDGRYTVLAPDGPDGPAYEAKPGALFLARKTGALVVPFGGWSRPAIQMRRWDRYLLPLPFARLHVVFGQPFTVEPKARGKAANENLVRQLHQVRNRARVLAGVKTQQAVSAIEAQ